MCHSVIDWFYLYLEDEVSKRAEVCVEADKVINMDVGGIGVLLGLFLPSIVLLIVLVSVTSCRTIRELRNSA